MKNNNNNKTVGCTDCYELSEDYILVDNGKKLCPKCGGTALNMQEAFDKIADLKSQRAIYEQEL